MDNKSEIQIENIKKKIIEYFSATLGEDSNTFQIIKDRMNNLKIEMIESGQFKSLYEETYGKGTLIPSGVYARNSGIVVLHYTNFDMPRAMETAIHEIVHALSDNRENKIGLYEYKEGLGRTFNEMATCYITSKIMGKGYGGSYSRDHREVFKAFIQTTKMDDNELYKNFFENDNWITTELCERFDKNNPDSLKELISLYDKRSTKDFDKTKVLEIIEQSVKTNDMVNTDEYREFVKNYFIITEFLN